MKLIGTRKMLKFKYGLTDEDIDRGTYMGYEIILLGGFNDGKKSV